VKSCAKRFTSPPPVAGHRRLSAGSGGKAFRLHNRHAFVVPPADHHPDMTRNARIVATLALTVLAGCGGGGGPTPAAAPPPSPAVERSIAPADTDPSIDVHLQPHFAVTADPAAGPRGRLFVFLPGTGATPAQYQLIVRAGAARGYHSVGLNYVNGVAVATLCNDSADVDCHGNVRREVVLGEDRSPLVAVSPANSIVNRLARLIAHLHARFPGEGWGQFLADGALNWGRIGVAGHSQGGGHAAYLAKLFELDRAVYFSSPSDWRKVEDRPAAWVTSLPNRTPAARQFAFSHEQDPLVPLATAAATWSALGIGEFGPLTSVDRVAPPFGGSHQLTTAAPPQAVSTGISISPLHGAPVVDAVTPRIADGAPGFALVWAYLCFP
jgi:hypothetical protein